MPRRSRRRPQVLITLAVVVASAIALRVGTDPAADATPPTSPTSQSAAPTGPSPAPRTPSDATSALDVVALLEVKGRAPKTGYDRELFGQAWADADRNGCGTRDDILARDLVDEVFKEGTQDCVVLSGSLSDPYSGSMVTFKRGQDTSSAVQIDHVVALSDSWQKGAQQWDATTREKFANDPLNLLAVDGPLNSQKGDGDTATWLPPNTAYRCQYVARQVSVKHAYGLWVTAAERDAMVSVLSTCPQEPLPGPSLQ